MRMSIKPSQIAKILGCSRETIHKDIRNGILHAEIKKVVGGGRYPSRVKTYFVDDDDARDYIKERKKGLDARRKSIERNLSAKSQAKTICARNDKKW